MNGNAAPSLVVNGERLTFGAGRFPGRLADLAQKLNVDLGASVAEVNGRVVRRADAPTLAIADGDVVELVRFVGGG